MTQNGLDDIIEMHNKDKCLPFIEFELKNGAFIRFVRMSGRYVCVMSPSDANFFLTAEEQQ